jgi:hypothetical protein
MNWKQSDWVHLVQVKGWISNLYDQITHKFCSDNPAWNKWESLNIINNPYKSKYKSIDREEEGVVCVYQSLFLLSRASATMLTFAGKMTHRLLFLPDIELQIKFTVSRLFLPIVGLTCSAGMAHLYCILLSRLSYWDYAIFVLQWLCH